MIDLEHLRISVSNSVREWRDYIEAEMKIESIHTREVDAYQAGHLGGKSFSRPFLHVVSYPPTFLVLHRTRKWPVRHYRERHIAFPEKCRCRRRLGFRLVEAVVIWRQSIEECMRRWGLTEQFALNVLGDEIRTIENILRREGRL